MNLHPIMAQAIAPWAPAPVVEPGLLEFTWSTELLSDVVVCHLDYIPEVRGHWRGTFCVEPDVPAYISLRHAFLRGVDIIELLDASQIDEIEQAALRYEDPL